MNMKINFITEGSSTIGFGHLERCRSLYQAFEDRGIIPLFIINGDETTKDLLKEEKHAIYDWMTEKEQLNDMIKGSDISFVDSYLADDDVYEKVSASSKMSVYIDDNNRLDYPEGIVLNGNIHAEELDYKNHIGQRYLLGTGYSPIRREFREVSDREIRGDAESVVITLGSSDVRNMTPVILKMLVGEYPEMIKKVIVGKGYENTKDIEQVSDSRTEIVVAPDAEGMKQIMTGTDMAISAGGQTLYELARTGVPAIVVAVADNQLNNIEGWKKSGFIEYAGWWEDKGILHSISRKVELLKKKEIREKKAEAGMALVDGKGAARSVRYCLERYFEKGISLREANLDDMHDIYHLSNEAGVRNSSLNGDTIELEHHKMWFANKLNDDHCLFLIAEFDNDFLGQVRFDMEGKVAIISISITSDFRGFGIGRLINMRALQYLKTVIPGITTVKAYIKEGNIPSVTFFEKSNFRFHSNMRLKNQNVLGYTYQFAGK
jgi:spore coat polysaccharide biosynthesis predicted glycosyltransferase SpsG/RimJ/RimL family protein N-acetyltransferase